MELDLRGTSTDEAREAIKTIEAYIAKQEAGKSCDEIGLTAYTATLLQESGISTVGELISLSEKELAALNRMGPKAKREIVECLGNLGLRLRAQ
jgi:DNA-directed RNA polymerase alpha subunit